MPRKEKIMDMNFFVSDIGHQNNFSSAQPVKLIFQHHEDVPSGVGIVTLIRFKRSLNF